MLNDRVLSYELIALRTTIMWVQTTLEMLRRGACSELAASPAEAMSSMAFSAGDRPVVLSARASMPGQPPQRETAPLIQLICRVSAGVELFERGADGVLRLPKDAPIFTTMSGRLQRVRLHAPLGRCKAEATLYAASYFQ